MFLNPSFSKRCYEQNLEIYEKKSIASLLHSLNSESKNNNNIENS